jgi:5-hydroxyisourate hydrolase-like protein (transthyretin family)
MTKPTDRTDPSSASARPPKFVLGALSVLLVVASQALSASVINGTVLDAQNGMKLSSMVVAAYTLDGSELVEATTDSAGHYQLSLPSGDYRLLAYDPNQVYATAFAGNAGSFDTSPAINSDQNGYDFALLPGGVAVGSVTANGPVGNPTVAAYNLDGTRRGFVQVSSSGAYSILLPPGEYKLAAYDDTQFYATEFFSAQPDFETANVVAIQGQRAATGINFHLAQAARIAGTVLNAEAPTPLPNMTVTAYTVDGSAVATATTDSSGRFVLVVPAGTFRIVAADPSMVYATAFFGGAASFEESVPVKVESGELRTAVQIQAEPAGFVSGHVASPDTTSLCCITVVAYNPNGRPRASTRTDQNGDYRLVLPPGEFRIGAYDERLIYAPRFYAMSDTFQNASPVTVQRSETVSNVSFLMDRAARFSGVVVDSSGAPVGSISVAAYDRDGNVVASASTSAAGGYALAVPAGEYKVLAFDTSLRFVTAYAEGAASYEQTPSFSVEAGSAHGLDFALSRGTLISGTVIDTAGIALSGIEVAVLDPSGNRISTAVSDGGHFHVVLAAGNYKLLAFDPAKHYKAMFFDLASTLSDATTVTVTGTGVFPSNLTFTLFSSARRRAARH